ncbi:unnamed protein product [Urochloa decumbens]|uniref:KIB1-4 beta-propeller domain-containing protein n=1 Tax=Urochloa decumbens TaxID=240449 RepID=A0ABC9CZH8_9POAL
MAAANTRRYRGYNLIDRLPPELLAEIHGRVALVVDRFSFAAACSEPSRQLLLRKPEAPCRVLPGAATLFSLSDRRAQPGRSTRYDARPRRRRPRLHRRVARHRRHVGAADDGQPGRPRRQKATASSFSGDEFRTSFYHKVVLSTSPRSSDMDGGFAAMLILDRKLGCGAPAFATADIPNPAWRPAPFRDAVVGPPPRRRVRRHGLCTGAGLQGCPPAPPPPQVLDEERGQWEKTEDIGDAAVFVGTNTSVCVPAAAAEEHMGVRPGCVYFTNDQHEQAYLDWEMLRRYGSANCGYGTELRDRDVGVFSLRDGTVAKLDGLQGMMHPFWSLPAWFTPSI